MSRRAALRAHDQVSETLLGGEIAHQPIGEFAG